MFYCLFLVRAVVFSKPGFEVQTSTISTTFRRIVYGNRFECYMEWQRSNAPLTQELTTLDVNLSWRPKLFTRQSQPLSWKSLF